MGFGKLRHDIIAAQSTIKPFRQCKVSWHSTSSDYLLMAANRIYTGRPRMTGELSKSSDRMWLSSYQVRMVYDGSTSRRSLWQEINPIMKQGPHSGHRLCIDSAYDRPQDFIRLRNAHQSYIKPQRTHYRSFTTGKRAESIDNSVEHLFIQSTRIVQSRHSYSQSLYFSSKCVLPQLRIARGVNTYPVVESTSA